jgi:hypothetical protein
MRSGTDAPRPGSVQYGRDPAHGSLGPREFCILALGSSVLKWAEQISPSLYQHELASTVKRLDQGLTRLQQVTNDREYQQRRSKMSDQENRNPQQNDPQKSAEQKPGNRPNQPVQEIQQVPGGQPKNPQSDQEKHDQDKRKQA